jgi:hypothetical protein
MLCSISRISPLPTAVRPPTASQNVRKIHAPIHNISTRYTFNARISSPLFSTLPSHQPDRVSAKHLPCRSHLTRCHTPDLYLCCVCVCACACMPLHICPSTSVPNAPSLQQYISPIANGTVLVIVRTSLAIRKGGGVHTAERASERACKDHGGTAEGLRGGACSAVSEGCIERTRQDVGETCDTRCTRAQVSCRGRSEYIADSDMESHAC